MLLQYFLELSSEYVCLLGLVVLSCAAYQLHPVKWAALVTRAQIGSHGFKSHPSSLPELPAVGLPVLCLDLNSHTLQCHIPSSSEHFSLRRSTRCLWCWARDTLAQRQRQLV